MDKQLKPCPFCGYKKAKISERWNRHYIPYTIGEFPNTETHCEIVVNIRANVICNKCHAKGGTAVGNIGGNRDSTKQRYKIEEQETIQQRAIEAWNRRANNG